MVSPSRSNALLLLLAGLFLAVPVFPQAAIKLENTASATEVPPGGTVTIQSVTRNTSSAALTGFFSNIVNFDGGVFVSVTPDRGEITCEAQRCTANSITLASNATITVTSVVRVASTAAQGSTVTFRSSVTGFGGQIAIGFVFIKVQGAPVGSPQLDLTVENAGWKYVFTVTNVGNAPTEGPLYFEVYPTGNTRLTEAPELFFYGAPTGSGWRMRLDKVLQPQESFQLFMRLVFVSVRDTAGLTAVILGGGSPPDEVTVSDANPARGSPITGPNTLVLVEGRVRE